MRLAVGFVFVCAFLPFAPAAQEQQKITMAGYPAAGAPAVVTLISPGAEPRKALRYVLPANHKASMDMKMSMEMSGLPMAMPPIGLTMAFDLAVTSVAANGDISYTMKVTKAAMDAGPELAGAMPGGLDAIVGLTGSAVATNRGVTKSVKLDLDKLQDPVIGQTLSQMSQTVENISTPFPDEAVGVGARWDVRFGLNANGMTMFQRMEMEITAINGPVVTVRVKTEQTAPQQSIVNPALPAEAQMLLERLTSTGVGTGTVRTDSLVPTMSTDMTTITSMTVSAAGQSIPIAMDVKTKMSIGPGK